MKTKKEKEMTDKFYVAEEVKEQVQEIMKNYGDVFSHFSISDMIFLFKAGKNNPEKKHVSVKIVKEPYSLLSSKKIIFVVIDQWWKDSNYEERAKELIEGLVSIDIGKGGALVRRDFDIKTYSEFLKNGKLDFSRFSKVIPTEKKKDDLVLN